MVAGVCLWNGGAVCASRRRSSQGPLTKAYPQRYVKEAKRSDGTPTASRTRKVIPRTDTGYGPGS